MNKERRKRLEKAVKSIELAKDEVIALSEEEHEAYDNMPEGLQDSERGEAISENVDDLESAAGDLEDIIDTLREVIER